MSLPTFQLPLSTNGPPAGYGWEARSESNLSSSTAFQTGIDDRDVFLGQPRCIICGMRSTLALEHCHIVAVAEPKTWSELKEYNWIPQQAKAHPRHDARNGILLCSNHHLLFDAYQFFIHFSPDNRKFILVNYSGDPELEQHHGKAVALDINDRHAPFPSLFIVHEMRVRGFHPFKPTSPPMFAGNAPWQDWISSSGVFDNRSNSFFRHGQPPANDGAGGSGRGQPVLSSSQPMTNTGGGLFSSRTAELNDDVIASILAATRAMPSWKACEIEGTSWAGTAEENISKYVSLTGSSGT